MPRLALLAHRLADTIELKRHLLVGTDDLIEGIGDLACEAGLVAGQAYRKIAIAHRLQRAQQLTQVQSRLMIRAVGLRRLRGRTAGGRRLLRGHQTAPWQMRLEEIGRDGLSNRASARSVGDPAIKGRSNQSSAIPLCNFYKVDMNSESG